MYAKEPMTDERILEAIRQVGLRYIHADDSRRWRLPTDHVDVGKLGEELLEPGRIGGLAQDEAACQAFNAADFERRRELVRWAIWQWGPST